MPNPMGIGFHWIFVLLRASPSLDRNRSFSGLRGAWWKAARELDKDDECVTVREVEVRDARHGMCSVRLNITARMDAMTAAQSEKARAVHASKQPGSGCRKRCFAQVVSRTCRRRQDQASGKLQHKQQQHKHKRNDAKRADPSRPRISPDPSAPGHSLMEAFPQAVACGSFPSLHVSTKK